MDIEATYERQFNKLLACYTDGSLSEMQRLENLPYLDFNVFIQSKKDFFDMKNSNIKTNITDDE